jgi:hypothetical protein
LNHRGYASNFYVTWVPEKELICVVKVGFREGQQSKGGAEGMEHLPIPNTSGVVNTIEVRELPEMRCKGTMHARNTTSSVNGAYKCTEQLYLESRLTTISNHFGNVSSGMKKGD